MINIQFTSRDLTKLLAGLIGLEIFFAAAHIFIFIGPGVPWDMGRLLFNLDAEESLTTWFSTVQLFTVGVVLLLSARANQHEEYLPSLFLAIGGLLFVFLSADEGAVLHERTSRILNKRVPIASSIPLWIPFYATFGTTVLAAATPYLLKIGKRFPRESLIGLGGGGALFGGAAGLEIISKLFFGVESTPTSLQLAIAVEEFLEMFGVSLILYAVLRVSTRLCSEASARESFGHSRNPKQTRTTAMKGGP